MSEEAKVTTETVSEETTPEATTDSTDVGALIAESKKYRKRSQDAESKLEKLEEAKMIEEGKKDELIAKYQSENESLTSNSEKWASYEERKRASLLEQHPEDDRGSLANLPLETLEYVTTKINSSKANAPEVVGNTRQKIPSKPFSEMNEREKRAWHKDVLNNINKN